MGTLKVAIKIKCIVIIIIIIIIIIIVIVIVIIIIINSLREAGLSSTLELPAVRGSELVWAYL